MKMWAMRKAGCRSAFTMIEIMVAIGILAILATVTIVMVGGMDTKAKIARTQAQMKLLTDAVTAFKSATGYFPLAVSEDAWAEDWTDNDPNSFIQRLRWQARWQDYFRPTTNHRPQVEWTGASGNLTPTNIHMLSFQLDKMPESAKVYSQFKSSYSVAIQQSFDSSGSKEGWKPQRDNPCKLGHPLDNNLREVYQPQDAWGMPLRFWTNDVLTWGKEPTSGNWDASVTSLLSNRLQQANWGFFIESAGKDRKFGWWGQAGVALNKQDAEDNVYSVGK